MAVKNILTRAPVNKPASVMMNQRGCDESLRLNRMIDERRILRENVKAWTTESVASPKRRKELKRQLVEAGNRLAEINRVMQDNPDMKAASRFKSLNDAFVSIARDMLPANVVVEISRRARAAMRVKP